MIQLDENRHNDQNPGSGLRGCRILLPVIAALYLGCYVGWALDGFLGVMRFGLLVFFAVGTAALVERWGEG